MFKCKVCKEKDRIIDLLQKENENLRGANKELCDRFMSLNERAFLNFKAEQRSDKPLYPYGVDAKGEKIDYKDMKPDEATSEMFRAFGEEPITVEEPSK